MPLSVLLRSFRLGLKVVPAEPSPLMLAAGLQESIRIMEEYGVDGLSPFKEYPSPKEVTRRVYKAMIAAAQNAE
jgi:hypothetical protein